MRPHLLPILVLALAGCTLAPKYERPPLPVPDAYPAATAAGAAAPDLRWEEFFTDERLRATIARALESSRDLRVATLAVEKAAALYRIQRAERNPTIGIRALATRYRTPESIDKNGVASTSATYTVDVGLASWELDFFGRLRSLKARALEQYLASEEARRAARVSIVAAAAQAWLALAADRENLRIAKETLETQKASYALIEKSRDAGIASDLDIRQSESQVEAARAAVAAFEGAAAVDASALQLLVGAPLDAGLLPESLGAVTDPKGLFPGLPSEVLLKRPDILAAEHLLRAANANIGAARAAFFPQISLTAAFGTASHDLDGLFQTGTRIWSFTPQLLTPLFASGSLLANLKVSQVDRDVAVAQYEKTIQTAFAEVSDALALRATLARQREAQGTLVKSLEETLRLSDVRYKGGIDGYLGVLVAQRALYDAQRAQVGVRLAEEANLVTLYKVLGGGAP